MNMKTSKWVYVFALQTQDDYIPIYVGKATKLRVSQESVSTGRTKVNICRA
jgi:hypothetical protein